MHFFHLSLFSFPGSLTPLIGAVYMRAVIQKYYRYILSAHVFDRAHEFSFLRLVAWLSLYFVQVDLIQVGISVTNTCLHNQVIVVFQSLDLRWITFFAE